MSVLKTINIKVDNIEALKQAIKELGYEFIEGRRTMHTVYGDSDEVILQLKDDDTELPVGFIENDDGTYTMKADWYGLGINNEEFEQDLNVAYSKHKVINTVTQNGYSFDTMNENQEEIELKFSLWESDDSGTFASDFESSF